ncbi:MAG: helix-turn-helix domain-containing protein [Candidatus Competibacteraceae bacterium]|nr:helix-turn-helix domain-containing protein [Candidatus Competibacteraceae bacterium]
MPTLSSRWPTKRIALLAFPGANSLDVVGPLQVFASASRYMRLYMAADDPAPRIAYVTEIVGPQAGPIEMSAGFDMVARRGIKHVSTGVDTLLVAGGDGAAAVAENVQILAWLRHMTSRVRRIGSICTGAFILAAAGLLDGRRATTHWRQCSNLAASYPAITVEPDALHVRDGPCYTSAGVTAGMDLALALLEEDCGRGIALATAREIVAFLKRPGGQSQFSAHLKAQVTEKRPLYGLQEWILNNLSEDLSVEILAERAVMSPRNFARVFARETGTTPAKFVEHARLDAARRILEDSAAPLTAIAERCGFGHPENLRRAFQRHLNVAPQDYRQRFRTVPITVNA